MAYLSKSPGKPHLGKILVDRGLSENISSAIKTYISPFKNKEKEKIDADCAISAILSAGGTPIWAHPLGGENERRLNEDEFKNKLNYLMSKGLLGLECFYSRYSKNYSDFLLSYANKNNLLISGGSDYHGSIKSNLSLGKLNEENIPIDIDRITFIDKINI